MITTERQKSGKMIRLTQPQNSNPPVRANAPGVPLGWQPAGDAFSALYDDGSDRKNPALALPNPVEGKGAGRATPASVAATTRSPAARHSVHRHSLCLALVVDPGATQTAQLPAALPQDEPDTPQTAVTQADESAADTSDALILGAIPVQPLDPAGPVPRPAMDAIAEGTSEITQPLALAAPPTDPAIAAVALLFSMPNSRCTRPISLRCPTVLPRLAHRHGPKHPRRSNLAKHRRRPARMPPALPSLRQTSRPTPTRSL